MRGLGEWGLVVSDFLDKESKSDLLLLFFFGGWVGGFGGGV